MRERPILFSAPMIRAILSGAKTQTRRVVKHERASRGFEPGWHVKPWGFLNDRQFAKAASPFGQPGDRLWVRESFRFLDSFDGDSPTRVEARCLDAGYRKPWAPRQYEADGARLDWIHVGTPPHDGPPAAGKLRPGIHMPRWASRITLEVEAVRVERLQAITEADAIAEGTPSSLHQPGGRFAVENFEHLWWTLHGDGAWEANPWVWRVEFRRLLDDVAAHKAAA